MPRSAPRPRSIADELELIRDDFDRLCHEAAQAPLSHQTYHRLDEDADGICRRVRAAFRGSRRP